MSSSSNNNNQEQQLPVVPVSTTTPQQQQESTTTPSPPSKNIAYQILLDALGSFRNGLVYGTKVRAPHSFVVYALWSSSPWSKVFQKIITLTTQHATNLALAGAIFKIGMHLLKLLSTQHQSLPWHYFLMGGVGGYFVWGEPTPVHTQVNMYMMSRVLSGLLNLFFEMRERQEAEKKKKKLLAEAETNNNNNNNNTDETVVSPATPKTTGSDTSLLTPTEQFIYGPRGYRIFVGAVWATALYLFHHHEQHVQSSLKMSMQYIYKDGDKHNGSLRKVLLGF